MVASYLLVLGTVAVALAGADDLPDCTCKKNWWHEELKCGKNGGKYLMSGCPSLEQLGDCEDEPKQSWCVTNEQHCKQQSGAEMVNQTWAFCEPETRQGVLPFCECDSKWTHTEPDSTCSGGQATMYGCPSLKKLAECEPLAKEGAAVYGNMSWCKTTYDTCQSQVDYPNDVTGETEMMVGEGWSMCDADSGYAEMPDCECKEKWGGANTCATGTGGETPFSSCTSHAEYTKQCEYPVSGLHQQDFCEVKFSPCKQQSDTETGSGAVDAVTDMIGGKYAYCDVATEEPEYPQCRCKKEWYNTDGECKGSSIKMGGCPTAGELRKCDPDVANDGAYCDTTYTHCDEQGYEQDEDGGGWAYCDSESGEAEYPTCVCMNDWKWTSDEDGSSASCNKPRMRGCPTHAEIQRCQPDIKEADIWCDTKDMYCRGQEGTEAIGQGWVYCNPESQWARETGASSSVGAAVGITFVLTVIFCTMLFIAFLYAYKEYLNHHKKGYSQELLQS